jgi:hypothetical protein
MMLVVPVPYGGVRLPPVPEHLRDPETLLPMIRRELEWGTRHQCADGHLLEDEDAILAVMLAGKAIYCTK